MNKLFFYYKKVLLQNYCNFKDRARRKELGMFCVISLIIGIITAQLDRIFGLTNELGLGLIGRIYSLTILLPALSLCVRRLHDIGKSGGGLLLTLIPLVGGVGLFILFIKDSQPGKNKYGQNPKYSQILKNET